MRTLAACLLFFVAGCSTCTECDDNSAPLSVGITPPPGSLRVGDELVFELTVKGTTSDVEWEVQGDAPSWLALPKRRQDGRYEVRQEIPAGAIRDNPPRHLELVYVAKLDQRKSNPASVSTVIWPWIRNISKDYFGREIQGDRYVEMPVGGIRLPSVADGVRPIYILWVDTNDLGPAGSRPDFVEFWPDHRLEIAVATTTRGVMDPGEYVPYDGVKKYEQLRSAERVWIQVKPDANDTYEILVVSLQVW